MTISTPSYRQVVVKLIVLLIAWIGLYLYLNTISIVLTTRLLNLDLHHRLGSTVQFFLFEAPKVLMLLLLIVFVVGVIRSFFTPERTRQMLAGRREAVGSVLAAAWVWSHHFAPVRRFLFSSDLWRAECHWA